MRLVGLVGLMLLLAGCASKSEKCYQEMSDNMVDESMQKEYFSECMNKPTKLQALGGYWRDHAHELGESSGQPNCMKDQQGNLYCKQN